MAKTAIVTGSGRGIGKAIALGLAHDGFDICINDVAANDAIIKETVGEIKKLGRNAVGIVADVSKRSEVAAMVADAVKALGPLEVMVANAGIAQVKPLLELTEEDVEKMFQVNVFGVHNCYSEAAKQMIKQGKRDPGSSNPYKIIGAASIVAFKPFPMLSHYSSSKWAVRGLTQAFAMEMADYGITVTAYAPGIVGTAMWDLIDEKLGEQKGVPRGETIKKYVGELTALKRTSVPEDVAQLVSFLAGPGSAFITGQTICVDGGICFN